MRESDYIACTNLAKLRIAQSILRECDFEDSFNEALRGEMVSGITREIRALEDAIDKALEPISCDSSS